MTQSQTSRIAILASGNGSNAEEIIRHFRDHANIEVVLVLTNNPKAQVIDRAARLGVDAHVFSRHDFRETTVVLDWLREKNVTHIVLAGFLWLIPDYLLKSYPDKIINIHPALLPKHGGKGMYGMAVHEAVKKAGDEQTGITIHLINERYDEGRVLFQESCEVSAADTAAQIAEKVHALEYASYPRVIETWINAE